MIKSLVKNLFKSVDGDDQENDSAQKTSEEPKKELDKPETSPNTIKVAVLSDDQDKFKLSDIEEMLKEMLSSRTGTKKKAPTPYILTTEDAEWYYDPVNRQMIRVHPGTELVLSDPEPNDEGKVMCYCDLGFILVPKEQISELGYN